jgi:hypothetical protein
MDLTLNIHTNSEFFRSAIALYSYGADSAPGIGLEENSLCQEVQLNIRKCS